MTGLVAVICGALNHKVPRCLTAAFQLGAHAKIGPISRLAQYLHGFGMNLIAQHRHPEASQRMPS